MAEEAKTKPTKASVDKFIKSQPDEQVRKDCAVISKLMSEATGEKPKMWGPSIIGFGSYHYKYATGREGDMPIIGFSPRKQNLTLYVWMGFEEHPDLWKKLGKHTTSKACLYIKRLSDVDLPTLKKIIKLSVKRLKSHGFHESGM
ncbi:MAG TPA: DUF1801 domain-containing protein [Pyrinomonadaceae bacterium]|nr:DUF1801 domain-containing protein [Pyrinomonadaceae bacterium]